MIESCGGFDSHAMYHPFKIGIHGYQKWSYAFDAISM